jgi:hypothetical protein
LSLAWNVAALESSGLILISVADDLLPPAGWDAELMMRVPINIASALMVRDGLSR